MPRRRRIDPIRHWSILLFLFFAVIGGTIELGLLARFRLVNLNAATWREHKWIGAILAVSLILGFGAWISFINALQDWFYRLRTPDTGAAVQPHGSQAPATPWLARPLMCQRRIVRPGLDPTGLTVHSLPDICLRMRVILDTIEMSRGEGRHMPVALFDQIDDLENQIRQRPRDVRLADWQLLIREFGQHYELDGPSEPIEVDTRSYDEAVARWHPGAG